MKYITLLFTLFLMSVLGAQAQEEDRRLTIGGQVMDADLKEPMVQATIQLFTASDSTFVGGTVSNERGNFYLSAPSSGEVRL